MARCSIEGKVLRISYLLFVTGYAGPKNRVDILHMYQTIDDSS
jgi:hypothetical protein